MKHTPRLLLAILACPLAILANSRGPWATITPEDAKAHHLPAVELAFQYDSKLELSKYPDAKTYLRLITTRSGVWGFHIDSYRGPNSAGTARAALAGEVEKQFTTGVVRTKVTYGQAYTVDVAGGKRQALSCISGQALARHETCVVLLPTNSGEGAALFAIGPSAATPQGFNKLSQGDDDLRLIFSTLHLGREGE